MSSPTDAEPSPTPLPSRTAARRFGGPANASRPHLAPRRLGTALLISFGLTVASFIVSTLVLRSRAAGIGSSAESIALNAAPSIAHLSAVRTVLRRMEVTLDDFTDRVAGGRRADGEDEQVSRDRSFLSREWARYAALPEFPGERALWPGTLTAWDAMNRSVDRVLVRIATRDGRAAEEILNQEAKPAIGVLDDHLNAIEELNAAHAASLGQRILTIRQSVRRLSNVLDVACALFAALAAIIAVRLVRRYERVMEERLSELEHFSARVAHDIRSPLAAVSIALQMVERKVGHDPNVKGLIGRATGTLHRIGQLVDGLLLFARAGATPPPGVSANVKEVIDGVVEQLAVSARDKEIELAAEPIDAALAGACSPGALGSMVANLVENALKYMGEAPLRRVTVRACLHQGKLRVEVEDTGGGMSDELQAKAFDPYVRGAHEGTPGLGLGLATVRRLAEGHGGAVGVASSPGAGSRFWIELPVRSVRPSPVTAAPAAGELVETPR